MDPTSSDLIIIKVVRDDDLAEQIGKDVYFDLVDLDKVRSFRIQKQMTFNVFKEEVAREFSIPVQFQRFWLWAKRVNHTYRPHRPLTPLEETQSVGTLREIPKKLPSAELKLFLEVELGLDLRPIAPPDKTKEDILLFFKHYDPEKEELRFIGRLFVKSTGKPIEILSKLNKMAGYAPDEEIDLYEEIKFEPWLMCDSIDKIITFRASQLEDGDIVCFQKSLPVESTEQFRYPDVPSFLEYVHNRQNAQLVQTVVSTVPIQTVVSDVTLQVSSSPVPVHNDASAFGTFGAFSDSTSTKVDFHGFSVLSQYVKYLENIYLKEGEFWNTCIFKSVDFISCILDILGKAFLIADAPWSSISPKKLCLMLQLMDDAIKAGFKLECVDTCTSRVKAFLSIEVNKTELEAEMKEVTGKIVSLQKELELQKNREAELQKQLEALSQFNITGSSPWSYIVG